MLVIEVTDHAIERYGERVRPALVASQLEAEVMRVIALGEVVWDRPCWAGTDHGINAWVLIGDGIAFPLQQHWSGKGSLVAVTCVTRAAVGDRIRKARNARAHDRRERRAARRKDRYMPRAA